VHVPAIVAAALDTIRPSADAKGLTLEVDVAADPRATIHGDPVRLQQVIWNLLTNAVKFTPAHGWVKASVGIDDTFVEVRVSDNGRGIRPEFLELIFDRFRSADAGTTRAEGGLGLGLAIARQLVEMHGGTLTASSEGENHGATFLVRLPRQTAQPRHAPRGPGQRQSKETKS
jgi:signal transduction histidine kinase